MPLDKATAQTALLALDLVRLNAVQRSEYHYSAYQRGKKQLHRYELPAIGVSALNALVAAATAGGFLPSVIGTTICTALAVVCGAISGLKLFHRVRENMDADVKAHRDFSALAIGIFETLTVRRAALMQDSVAAAAMAEKKILEYTQLTASSPVPEHALADTTMPRYPIVSSAETDAGPDTIAHWLEQMFDPARHKRRLKNRALGAASRPAFRQISRLLTPVPSVADPRKVYSVGADTDDADEVNVALSPRVDLEAG